MDLETLGILALAVLTVAFGAQKIVKEWRTSDTESKVMQMMHQELERMGAQNKLLGEEVGKLHAEIIKLNTELSRLCVENDKLQQEVIALTSELNAFKKLASVRKVKELTNAASKN